MLLQGRLAPLRAGSRARGAGRRSSSSRPPSSRGQEENLALDLGLFLDTGESMAKEMRLTPEAALRFLEAIPRARDLVTIFFDQDARISRYDSEHQQGLFQRIVESRASGNTALYEAIAV